MSLLAAKLTIAPGRGRREGREKERKKIDFSSAA